MTEQEFVVLYDVQKSKKQFPYWKYDMFDLNKIQTTNARSRFVSEERTFINLLNLTK